MKIYVYYVKHCFSAKNKLLVKLNANRVVIGTLRGFDQFMNLVVDNTVEVNGDERNDIWMVVLRGNSVVIFPHTYFWFSI
ncbi:probable small nuclear ribonucleoprotein G isoform X2 [Lolium perenne]